MLCAGFGSASHSMYPKASSAFVCFHMFPLCAVDVFAFLKCSFWEGFDAFSTGGSSTRHLASIHKPGTSWDILRYFGWGLRWYKMIQTLENGKNMSSAWKIGRDGGRDGADCGTWMLWIAEVLCEWEFTSPCQQQSWNSWALQWILGLFSYFSCRIWNLPSIFLQQVFFSASAYRIGWQGTAGDCYLPTVSAWRLASGIIVSVRPSRRSPGVSLGWIDCYMANIWLIHG